MKRRRILTTLGLVIVGGLVLAASATIATASDTKESRHDEVVAFWTKERVAKAKPRDFVFDPASRRLIAESKRPATTDVTGASWAGGGDVAATTGRVFFSLGSSYYLCSGSVVQEAEAERSIVLTAAHCAYDEVNGIFAENWMFVPDYDAMPAQPTIDGSFCSSTSRGCWSTDALVVAEGYATAGAFNDQAVVHDYAYAIVGVGGFGDTQLDATVGAQAVRFDGAPSGTDSWLFGYPAAGRYKGDDLTYCRGSLGFDPWLNNQTYRVKCNMTGGSSGGPWFAPFSAIDGAGSIMSVNSYGYQGVKAMFGRRLGSEASAMFDVALAADADTVYGSG